MAEKIDTEQLVEQVGRSQKYAQLAGTLVSRITKEEAKKHKSQQEIIRSARTRLHQLTGAYLAPKIDYTQWLGKFQSLDPSDRLGLESTSLNMMRLHASTYERIKVLPTFFQTSLASISPVKSVLDLACGLNPLSIPWMPLAYGFTYFASDVVSPLVYFLWHYFELFGYNANASILDLSFSIPSQPVQLALLMKTVPLLEHIEHGLSQKVLENLNAEHILVTYPLRSLGGRKKGMEETYRSQFDQLVGGRDWKIREFRFPNEVAYLVTK
jgi:16S rRNA (guanine(1405)-N(7))-methyltransferase